MAENTDVKEKEAITRVSLGALAKLLRLPPDVAVGAVAVEAGANGTLSILLTGEGLPERCVVKENEPPQTVGLVYRVTAFAMLEKIE